MLHMLQYCPAALQNNSLQNIVSGNMVLRRGRVSVARIGGRKSGQSMAHLLSRGLRLFWCQQANVHLLLPRSIIMLSLHKHTTSALCKLNVEESVDQAGAMQCLHRMNVRVSIVKSSRDSLIKWLYLRALCSD